MPYSGYYTESGYWGLVNDKFILFATDSDYYEYLDSRKENDNDTSRSA